MTTYFSITLFSLRFVMPENRINVVNYIDTVSKPSLNSNFKKTIQVLKSIVVLRKWISKNKIGFIHAHYSSSYGLLGGFLNHKTLVSSFWGSDIMDFPKKSIIHQLVIKWILMRSTFLMSTSISMKIELNKYTSKSVFLTPFGVDTDLFIPKTNSKDGDGIIIGTIKSLNSVYGIDKLIHAFDLIVKSKQNSQLHIYGKGDEKRNLKTLAKSLGLEHKVFFKGFVSGDNLVEAYQSLDIFVALSRRESFGVSVLEASSCQIPVVVSNVGGLPEVVENNKTGFIVENGNSDLAAEKIILLSESENLRNEFGTKGREFVIEKYKLEQVQNNMLTIYRAILEKIK